MDERLLITRGRVGASPAATWSMPALKDIGWWVAKHNGYATRQMIDFIAREYGLIADRDAGSLNAQGRRKRFMRDRLYARAPLYLRAVLYFFVRYLLKLGFLDGKRRLHRPARSGPRRGPVVPPPAWQPQQRPCVARSAGSR